MTLPGGSGHPSINICLDMFNLQMKLSLGRKGRLPFYVWAVQLCLEYQSEMSYKAATLRDYLRNLAGPKWQRLRDQKVWYLCSKPEEACVALRSAPKSQTSGQLTVFRAFSGNKELGEEPGEVGLSRGLWIKY